MNPLTAHAPGVTPARVATLALAVGLAAQVLLHGHELGVNVVLAAAVLLCAAAVATGGIRRMDRLDAWIPVTALGLAGFVAVRDDGPLVALDVLGALGLCAASVPAFAGESVTRRTTSGIVGLAARVLLAVSAGAVPLLGHVRREAGPGPASVVPGRRAVPVLRGLLLAGPLVVVCAALFASADPIFGRWLERLTTVDLDLGDIWVRAAYVAFTAWLAGGLLWFGWVAAGARAPVPQSLGAAASSPASVVMGAFRLGVTEAVTIVVALDLLFGAFVALQVAYLFGGLDTLGAIGMTYSDYARRGFFELVAVVVLVGGLLLGLEAVVAVRTRVYVAAVTTLIGLTSVVLASSWLRLGLYEQAYGWTELRFYVAAAIVFLAINLAAAGSLVLAGRTRWLPHAVATSSLVVLVGVNLVGPQAFITARNLERSLVPGAVPGYGDPSLDAGYLDTLGADAIPAVVDALPRMTETQRAAVTPLLEDATWRYVIRADERWPAWNLARVRAREALERWSAGR